MKIYLKKNSILIVFFTNGLLVTAHPIFLMRTFSSLCYVVDIVKMLHPFVTNS